MVWILLVLVVVAIWFVVSLYNRLVRARNGYRNAFAQIDVQLVRRHDLIPNLVETAKGYMKHERETLEAVVAAAEASPDLKANQNMRQLWEKLPSTETGVASPRQSYNDSVMGYNNRRE